jgi:hypothetical protein
MSTLGFIRKITPSDTTVINPPFTHIQVGVSGDVTIENAAGESTLLSSEIIDKMTMVPVGACTKVMATGTAATDVYVWV